MLPHHKHWLAVTDLHNGQNLWQENQQAEQNLLVLVGKGTILSKLVHETLSAILECREETSEKMRNVSKWVQGMHVTCTNQKQ